MMADTWQRLEEEFADAPLLRAEPVPDEEISAASAELGRPFPDDYQEFIRRYGGAALGDYRILGLRMARMMGVTLWNVVEVNRRYRAQGWPYVDQWLVVAVDGAGNPVGISEDGRVWVYDHDYRQVLCIGEDFEDFLRQECLDLGEDGDEEGDEEE